MVDGSYTGIIDSLKDFGWRQQKSAGWIFWIFSILQDFKDRPATNVVKWTREEEDRGDAADSRIMTLLPLVRTYLLVMLFGA